MKAYLSLFSLISFIDLGKSVQPYFPPQIVFTPDNGQSIYAIDEINQRAYRSIPYTPTVTQRSYAMKHFPFAAAGSPQSKYYVQLIDDSSSNDCQYGTYWKYGENNFNNFPAHWWFNTSSFKVDNYLDFKYEMIHTNDSAVDEDLWYSNVSCQIAVREVVPCEEVYFKKDTEIPLRSVQVVRRGWDLVQVTTNYQVISIGQPDEKYFDSIPKNWSANCRDVNLALLYEPTLIKIILNQSSKIHLSLAAPPHRINGNDTVRIRWNASQCNDCFTWTPKELYFDSENFQQKQVLVITRIKVGSFTTLTPNFSGGAYEFVPPDFYPIVIE